MQGGFSLQNNFMSYEIAVIAISDELPAKKLFPYYLNPTLFQ